MTLRPFIAATALGLCGIAQAQDRAEVAPSQILGNRELPKVLYIVPWKKPAPDALQGRPPVSVLDEALAPLDRDVFRRQLAYRAAPPNAPPNTPPNAQTAAPPTAAAGTKP